MAITAAKQAWLERVLGVGGGDAGGEVRAPGSPPGPLVVFRQSLLRWRAAQQQLDEQLAALGRQVLALPEVQADPRFARVQQAVGELRRAVPAFGTQLAHVLDEGLNATAADEQARLAAQARALIVAYRGRLASAAMLQQLEAFAAGALGAQVPLHSAMDAALAELHAQLPG